MSRLPRLAWIDGILGALRSPRSANRQLVARPAARGLAVECLEQRYLMAAVPTVSLSGLAADPLIGEDFSFVVRFDNTSPTDVGFGPYVNLFLPTTGIDGAGSAIDDGITFVSASYLGFAVEASVITLTAGGVEHPFAVDGNGNPLIITSPTDFEEGDQLVVLTLPFGSFTPAQPPADIIVNVTLSELADVDAPLPIRAEGGFRFGDDALDNPTQDPPITGAAAIGSVSPAIFRFTKTYLGPENETTTGPNFPRQYRISVDMADGQTITGLELSDLLPGQLQFVSVDSVTGNGTTLVLPLATPSTSTPGGTLTRRLNTVTGTAGGQDAELTFTFYVPQFDDRGNLILDPATGDDVAILNNASGTADWTPLDPRDAPTTVMVDPMGPEHVLTAKSIAIQKTNAIVVDVGAAGTSPGDTLEYTLRFQISDYFAFGSLLATDILGDGLEFVLGSSILEVDSNGYVLLPAAMQTSNVQVIGGINTTINFFISQELISRGQNGQLIGGLVDPMTGQIVPPSGDGATTALLRFRATVLDRYKAPPNKNVSQGDTLGNNVSLGGSVLEYDPGTMTFEPNGLTEDDDSQSSVSIAVPSISKTLYAINGDTGYSSTEVSPGDVVTYRLRYQFASADEFNVSLTDYLPLPIFDATEVTTFNYTRSGAPPPAGVARLLLDDTLSQNLPGLVPTMSVDATNNTITFTYGNIDDPQSRPSVIDIVFSVTVTDDPFADELLLTNLGVFSAENSNGEPTSSASGGQVTIREPELNIKKGVIGSENGDGIFAPATTGPVAFTPPGSSGTRFTGTITSANLATNPIDSNLSNVDAGDLVSFAIVIENTGGSPRGAFDLFIGDTLPPGMLIPGIGPEGYNLRVTDGAGNALAYQIVGTSMFEPFGGIRILDPSPQQGAIGMEATDGSNIIVITYDLRIGDVAVLDSLIDTASIKNYAAQPGGPDFTPVDPTDDAIIVIAREDLLTKQLVGTEIVDTYNGAVEAVIGELVTYEVTITVPEGHMDDVLLVDTLDPQLAFVSLDSVFTSPDLSFVDPSLPAPLIPTITNSGGTIAWNLGDIVNSNRDNSVPETITFRYTAVVLNVSGAQGGTLVNNRAVLSFESLDNPRVASAANVTIIEPRVQIDKSVEVNGGGAIGEGGDPIEYTIVLANPPGSNSFTADAFDVTFQDVLPFSGLLGSFVWGSLIDPAAPPVVSVVDTAGFVTSGDFVFSGNSLSSWTLSTQPGFSFDMPVDGGRTITITITGFISPLVAPGQSIRNTAEAQWTSLDGEPGERSTFNPNSTERTGVGGLNDYVARDNATFTILNVDLSKRVVATSETATADDSEVVVGEIVRYRLEAAVPEGAAVEFSIIDLLPPGMLYLEGTANIVFVGDPTDLVGSLSIPLQPGLKVDGNETTVGGIPAVVPLDPSLISVNTTTNEVTFDLGLVFNVDTAGGDMNFEYVVIEFNALVLNVPGNQAGQTLVNVARVSTRDPATTDPATFSETASVTVTVAEPQIGGIQKAALDSSDLDAGDVVAYSISFTNEAGAHAAVAYDVRVFDALVPGKMTLAPGPIIVLVNGVPVAFTNNSTPVALDITLASLNVGDTVRVVYEALLTDAVIANETLVNTADVTWTSIPGLRGTLMNPTGSQVAVGSSGLQDGERTGQDGIGGALNDYAGSASAAIDVAIPEFDKSIANTSPIETTSNQLLPNLPDFAVGEIVTYRLTAVLQEGTTTLVIQDLLPDLLTRADYFSSRVLSIGANISGSNLNTGDAGTVSGQTVTFDFGTVVNAGDNVIDGRDQIIVEIVAQFPNVPENQEGDLAINIAQLDYGGVLPLVDVSVAQIVEPALTIEKEVVAPASTMVDAGDVVTYRITVSQDVPDSTAIAFNVLVSETLPVGLLLVGAPIVVYHPNYPSSFYELPIVTVSGNSFRVLVDYLDHPDSPFGPGIADEVIIEYQARVDPDTTTSGDVITNTANLSWDSFYVPSTVDAHQSRNYTGSDDAAITLNSNSIAGFVYVDLNDNGLYEPGLGESLITESVTLTLSGTDRLGRAVSTTLTTTTGQYLFDRLGPSDASGYRVTEINQPLAYADGRDTAGAPFGGNNTLGGTPRDLDAITGIVIVAGSNLAGVNYNFGELPPAALGDFVWEDLDGDGIQDPGEPGVDGLLVTLSGTQPDGTPFTLVITTSGGGAYTFDQLRPGAYTITFAAPTGYVFTMRSVPGATAALDSDADRKTGEADVTLGIGETNLTIDAGVYLGGSLAGFVYRDINNNGVKELGGTPPEDGIAGARVILTGVDPLGNGLPTRSTVTGRDGSYVFDLLPQGTYFLIEPQPLQFLDGRDTIGSLGGAILASGGNPDVMGNIPLGVGQVGIDYNFGERTPAHFPIPPVPVFPPDNRAVLTVPRVIDGFVEDAFFRLPAILTYLRDRGGAIYLSSLSGYAYDDNNQDGVRSAGEPGLNKALIILSGSDRGGLPVNRSAYTDVRGYYEIGSLPAGVYTLREAAPPIGWATTSEEVGIVNGKADGEASGDGKIQGIELPPHSRGIFYNFGHRRTSSLGGKVFDDANGNNRPEGDEAGLEGVKIMLKGKSDRGESIELEVVSAADGRFTFEDLPAGTYSLLVAEVAGWLDGQPTAAAEQGMPGGQRRIDQVELPLGVEAQGYAFPKQRAQTPAVPATGGAAALAPETDNDVRGDDNDPNDSELSIIDRLEHDAPFWNAVDGPRLHDRHSSGFDTFAVAALYTALAASLLTRTIPSDSDRLRP